MGQRDVDKPADQNVLSVRADGRERSYKSGAPRDRIRQAPADEQHGRGHLRYGLQLPAVYDPADLQRHVEDRAVAPRSGVGPRMRRPLARPQGDLPADGAGHSFGNNNGIRAVGQHVLHLG